MHTTLALLKNTDACKGGYGRMISFFGMNKELTDQIIPLHVVALVGGADDAQWALQNSTIIEKEQFEAFRRKHQLSAVKHLLENVVYSHHMRDGSKNPIVVELQKEAVRMSTFEESEAWLQKIRQYNFNHKMFEVARHKCWSHPAAFIMYCMEHAADTFMQEDTRFGKSIYVKPEPLKEEEQEAPIAEPVRSTGSSWSADDDAEDYDEDEDEAPRARRAAPARNSRAASKKKSADVERHWFTTSESGRTGGQNIAFLFSPTPFDFVNTMEYRVPKGTKVEKDASGKAALKLSISDDARMFMMLRTMTKKVSEMTDLDQESDE